MEKSQPGPPTERLERFLKDCPVILAEGAVIERLRRDCPEALDPHVLNASMIHSPEGRRALGIIYRQYLDVGREFDLPLLILTPTWRANPERLRWAGLESLNVNGDACRFLQGLRMEYGAYAERVLIGGLMGCRGGAYDPREALSEIEAHQFHRAQAQALAGAGVDFLIASTLPALSEALGLARVFGESGRPYILSFVLRPAGTLLDGTPFGEAVSRIEGACAPPPAAYLANCTHPSILMKAMDAGENRDPKTRKRLIGLQGNTSARSPEELDGAARLDSQAPEIFARDMVRAAGELGLTILGGCCGTDHRHIRALAQNLNAKEDALI